MSLLQLLNSNNEMRIANRQVSRSNEMLQVIYVLLRTWSPFEELKLSLDELIGGSTDDNVDADIAFRLENVGTILKEHYDVKEMSVLDISTDESGQNYYIDLFIEYVDGTFEQGSIEVSNNE